MFKKHPCALFSAKNSNLILSWIIPMLICLGTSSQAAHDKQLLQEALKQTKKYYKRKYLFEEYHVTSFGTNCLYETSKARKDAERLYQALYEEGLATQEGSLTADAWVKKLKQNNHAFLKKILFKDSKKKQRSTLSLKEEQRIRLLMIILQKKINEQKIQHQNHPLWSHTLNIKSQGFGLVEYYNLPGLYKSFLAIESELHPKLDEVASDEMVTRLAQGARLFIENNPATIEHFKKTKEYIQDGKNTRYIIERHFNNENVNPHNIIACDYRYQVPGLMKTFTLPTNNLKGLLSLDQEEWRMIHLIYYPHNFDHFFSLKMKEILDLHNEGAELVKKLETNNHQFQQNPSFDKFYQEGRKILMQRLKIKLAEMRIIDDLLAQHENHKIKKILGKSVLFRHRERKFWNSYLEIKLYDRFCKELVQDQAPPKGSINLKLGVEHGYQEHKAIMDILQSDDEVILSAKNWIQHYRTPVQRKYFLMRIRELIDKNRLTKVTMQTVQHGKVEVVDIINLAVFKPENTALFELKTAIQDKNIVPIAYNEIVTFDLEESNDNLVQTKSLAAIIASALLATELYYSRVYKKNKAKKKTKSTTKRRNDNTMHQNVDDEESPGFEQSFLIIEQNK